MAIDGGTRPRDRLREAPAREARHGRVPAERRERRLASRRRSGSRQQTRSCTDRLPTSRFDLEFKHEQRNIPARDALDDKVNRLFAGKVVRKDLVRKVKVGANVPVFVLEYLLGKYCASSDEVAIQMGLQVVNDTLANNYIRPDESMKAQSKVKENGQVHLHRQGEGAARRLRLLGRGRSTSATSSCTSRRTTSATTSAC